MFSDTGGQQNSGFVNRTVTLMNVGKVLDPIQLISQRYLYFQILNLSTGILVGIVHYVEKSENTFWFSFNLFDVGSMICTFILKMVGRLMIERQVFDLLRHRSWVRFSFRWLGLRLRLTIRGFVIVSTVTKVSSILISCHRSEIDFNQLSPK